MRHGNRPVVAVLVVVAYSKFPSSRLICFGIKLCNQPFIHFLFQGSDCVTSAAVFRTRRFKMYRTHECFIVPFETEGCNENAATTTEVLNNALTCLLILVM